ncbi:hypothetical protein Tco_1520370, partial [Tanacetum coccineum]
EKNEASRPSRASLKHSSKPLIPNPPIRALRSSYTSSKPIRLLRIASVAKIMSDVSGVNL